MIKNEKIARTLITGVRNAIPEGSNERSVTTLITRPMWRLWNEMLAQDPEEDWDKDPTDWNGPQCTRRVFGSKTIVIESEQLWAVSFASRLQEDGE